jgi:hypothetical protein
MKKSRRGTAAALLFAGSVVAALTAGGCGETDLAGSSAAVDDDQETLQKFVEEEGLSGLSGPYDGERVPVESDGAAREEIDPLTFWRVVDQKIWEHTVVIDPEAGTAESESRVEVIGTLHILDEGMVEYVKPMHHTGVRYAEFLRDPLGTGQNGNGQGGGDDSATQARRGPWVLTAVSGLRAQSDALTMAIDWVRYQGAAVDVTVTDPLDMFAVPDGIMAFSLGEQVTVTVSGPPQDALVFLHAAWVRLPLQCQPDYTFAGTWTVNRRGRHNAWVQALAHASIFDSEYPDDSLVWGTPYRVLFE